MIRCAMIQRIALSVSLALVVCFSFTSCETCPFTCSADSDGHTCCCTEKALD